MASLQVRCYISDLKHDQWFAAYFVHVIRVYASVAHLWYARHISCDPSVYVHPHADLNMLIGVGVPAQPAKTSAGDDKLNNIATAVSSPASQGKG